VTQVQPPASCKVCPLALLDPHFVLAVRDVLQVLGSSVYGNCLRSKPVAAGEGIVEPFKDEKSDNTLLVQCPRIPEKALFV
jgi:hypothetical protein